MMLLREIVMVNVHPTFGIGADHPPDHLLCANPEYTSPIITEANWITKFGYFAQRTVERR
jgi:hypothetical protein